MVKNVGPWLCDPTTWFPLVSEPFHATLTNFLFVQNPIKSNLFLNMSMRQKQLKFISF